MRDTLVVNTLLVTIIFVVVLALGFLIGWLWHNQSVSGEMEDLSYYRQRYLSMQGATTFNDINSYLLVSFDGGKIWYAAEWGKDRELIILGRADEVYPGLLEYLEAWDQLENMTLEKGGPVDISDPDVLDLLSKAGFEVVTATPTPKAVDR